MTLLPEEHALLLSEGDWLTRRLAQELPASLERQDRLSFYGRSLAFNLIRAALPTTEHISWRLERPLSARLVADLRGRAAVQTFSFDGQPQRLLPADDLLEAALFVRGRLYPPVRSELLAALHGSEHAAIQALRRILKSRSVLSAVRRFLGELL